jgi:hypothetical protein
MLQEAGGTRRKNTANILYVYTCAQSCPTLYNSMDGSPPDFFVYVILQARILIGMGGHTLLQEIFPTWA